MSAALSRQGHLLLKLGIALRHFGSGLCAAEPAALGAYADLFRTRRAPGHENNSRHCGIGALAVWAK